MNNNPAPPPYSPPGVAPPTGYPPQPGYPPQAGYPPQPEFGQQPPYPTQPGFPQPTIQEVHYHPPADNTVIITNGPMLISSFGPSSQFLMCPSCHHTITTRVETEPSTKTHLFAFCLCMFGCWPCCFLPYCMDSCQSRNHYCPNCGTFLGSYDE